MAHPLQALRDVMAEYHIDAYLIPTADFHGSEYVGAQFACRASLSGVTGSADQAAQDFAAGKLVADPDALCHHHDGGHTCSHHGEGHGCGGGCH